MGVDLFPLDRPPEPFYKDVVQGTPAPIHADLHSLLLQPTGKLQTGKLCPLIGIEDRWGTLFQGFFQCFQAKMRLQAVGQALGQHIPTEPIHDRHQVSEPVRQANIRDVR